MMIQKLTMSGELPIVFRAKNEAGVIIYEAFNHWWSGFYWQ